MNTALVETFSDSLVIIPTYNEIENIESIIRVTLLQAHHFDVLIVDDNSPDGTALRVRQLQQEFPDRLFLAERTEKTGLGTAYIHGFLWGLNSKKGTTISLKWTPIFLIIPLISYAYTEPVRSNMPIWPLALAT